MAALVMAIAIGGTSIAAELMDGKGGAPEAEPERTAAVMVTKAPDPASSIQSFQTEKPESQTAVKSMDWDAEEAEMLARIAMAEAEGEDVEGKALVILVVLNRVWSEDFPGSIEEVIKQEGQFSAYENGRYDRLEPDEGCWDALGLVAQDHWDESRGALYFESEGRSTWHRDNLKRLFRHGGHIFYTNKE